MLHSVISLAQWRVSSQRQILRTILESLLGVFHEMESFNSTTIDQLGYLETLSARAEECICLLRTILARLTEITRQRRIQIGDHNMQLQEDFHQLCTTFEQSYYRFLHRTTDTIDELNFSCHRKRITGPCSSFFCNISPSLSSELATSGLCKVSSLFSSASGWVVDVAISCALSNLGGMTYFLRQHVPSCEGGII